MDFEKLRSGIEQFKQIYQKYYEETMPQLILDSPMFEFKNRAEEKDIVRLENEINGIIPTELRCFYSEAGQLIDENQPENLTLVIPSVVDLLSKKGNSKWTQTPTFGLIDMMRLHWANDRYELNEEQFLTAEQIAKLNENYTCIGYWCKEPFYEEAYFIVFNKEHQFAEVKYNQNRFKLLQTQLMDMLENGITEKTFEELLNTVFKRLGEYTLELGEN